jgi:hypothetical protein
MKFDLNDKNDWRIVNSSTHALDYPKYAGQAPNRKGVYILINSDNGVVRVGIGSDSTIKDAIKINNTIDNDKKAETYRWFITLNGMLAKELGKELTGKYLT